MENRIRNSLFERKRSVWTILEQKTIALFSIFRHSEYLVGNLEV